MTSLVLPVQLIGVLTIAILVSICLISSAKIQAQDSGNARKSRRKKNGRVFRPLAPPSLSWIEEPSDGCRSAGLMPLIILVEQLENVGNESFSEFSMDDGFREFESDREEETSEPAADWESGEMLAEPPHDPESLSQQEARSLSKLLHSRNAFAVCSCSCILCGNFHE